MWIPLPISSYKQEEFGEQIVKAGQLFIMSNKRLVIVLMMSLICVISAMAQKITGQVVDKDGYAIPYASITYRGHHIAVSSDIDGKFSIEKHPGWPITVTSVGFKSTTVKVEANTDDLGKIILKDDSRSLAEVVVKQKRGRYRRKDNPAVELMRRVIAAKKKSDLSNHPYYQYDKYQKITLAFNDITDKQLEGNFFKKRSYLRDQIEVSPFNGKRILPIQVNETVTQHVYRKNPQKEKDIIMGQQANGIGEVLSTGEILNTMLKEVFTDVDIYDDYVRLVQYPFVSPIGKDAISFYHFYIEDTTYVEKDKCYHLQFIPANQQDFGFRGELYVLADSTLHVRKVNLYMPKKSDVNWIDDMQIQQEYVQLENGEWVLSQDDMVAEIHANKLLQDLLVSRTTRLTSYSFNELPKQIFQGKAKVKHYSDAYNRNDAFWNSYRQVELTKSESSMSQFISNMENSKGFKYIIKGVQLLVENYVETNSDPKKKSKFDIGPINTFISSNYVDGLRLRLAGRTLAALNPHLFWSGYAAYGTKSHRWYYGDEFTWSLNKKQLSPFEFPQRNLTFETARDVMSPSDLNLIHNKDNIFMTIRSSSQKEMYLYNRQRLTFNYETEAGWRYNARIQTQSNQTEGQLHFYKVNTGEEIKKIRLTDATVGITWNPGVTYVNTKRTRLPVNLDSPDINLAHTTGFKGILGGDFNSNITSLSIYQRQWLGSWGFMDFHVKGQVQWNKVPFPLLIQPPVNLSYVETENTVSLVHDWEFLNDRQVFWSWKWDLNGKLLNRIPLIRKLKWREFVDVKGFWGTLTDKNNPDKNSNDDLIYRFPTSSHVMSNKPYWEVEAGIHNILKFISIGYVRRLTYNYPGISKWGIRFDFQASF